MRRRPSRRLQRCTRRHRYALSASRLSRARAQLGCGAPPCSAPPLPGDAACCGGDLAPPAPEPRTCCGPLDRRFARPEAPGAAWPAAPARCCRCRLCRAGRRFARQLPPAGPEMRKVCCCSSPAGSLWRRLPELDVQIPSAYPAPCSCSLPLRSQLNAGVCPVLPLPPGPAEASAAAALGRAKWPTQINRPSMAPRCVQCTAARCQARRNDPQRPPACFDVSLLVARAPPAAAGPADAGRSSTKSTQYADARFAASQGPLGNQHRPLSSFVPLTQRSCSRRRRSFRPLSCEPLD